MSDAEQDRRRDRAEPESTPSLLDRVRSDDPEARERLIARYLPALQRWARGRLPSGARDLADTDDLVQVTLLKTLDGMKGFEYRGKGTFMAYLRQVLQNQIRDALRGAARRPKTETLTDRYPEHGPSPLERAIGGEALRRYEAALKQLSEVQQEAVVLRVELGFTYAEIARSLGSPSPNAARMTIARAVVRLAEVMDE